MVAFGRLLQHDPKSRAFPVAAGPIITRAHHHSGPTLDQGYRSSCTGNAIAQALNTHPLRHGRPLLDEDVAVRLYSAATVLDEFPGTYPPDDFGSSGLAVCKAAFNAGLISGYRHAFSLNDALAALSAQPVIVGVNWYTGMLNPDGGYLKPTGVVEGGHEVALIGVNVRHQRVTVLNSWGPGWGANGRACLRWDDLGRLLAEQGDCTVPDVQIH